MVEDTRVSDNEVQLLIGPGYRDGRGTDGGHEVHGGVTRCLASTRKGRNYVFDIWEGSNVLDI